MLKNAIDFANKPEKYFLELDKNIVYSDKNIVDILRKKNIKVARRTVTKYRESLGIGNSIVRSKNNNP